MLDTFTKMVAIAAYGCHGDYSLDNFTEINLTEVIIIVIRKKIITKAFNSGCQKINKKQYHNIQMTMTIIITTIYWCEKV